MGDGLVAASQVVAAVNCFNKQSTVLSIAMVVLAIANIFVVVAWHPVQNKKNETGRYQLFQGRSREAIFYEKDGVVGGDNADQHIILMIDTKTGEVSKYEHYCPAIK